jgi:uncharacterized membrane protein
LRANIDPDRRAGNRAMAAAGELCGFAEFPTGISSRHKVRPDGDTGMIEELFRTIAGGVALGLEAIVVLIIAFAGAKAFIRTVPLLFNDDMLEQDRRAIWLRFATAILLALEFTLAADLIRSAISPSWDAIGKLAAIALIRILLNFFLARDIESVAEARRRDTEAEAQRRDAEARAHG